MVMAAMKIREFNMLEEFSRWDPMVKVEKLIVCSFFVKPKLKNDIIMAQKADTEYNSMKLEAKQAKNLSIFRRGWEYLV